MLEADVPAPRPAEGRAGSRIFRFSVARFLTALVLLFLLFPFVQELPHGPLIESLAGTLVMCLGVLAVGARRRVLIIAIILVVPAVLGSWVNHYWPGRYPIEAVFTARFLFLSFVVARLLIFILRARRVDSEVLCAGISVYLLMGLLWAFAYMVIGHEAPNAFAINTPPDVSHVMDRPTAFYFSFITLATVGYGDITPVSNGARVLAILEAISGTLFVGVLIARLVSLYSARSPANGQGQDVHRDV